MKRGSEREDMTTTDCLHNTCWQCVLNYCATQGPLDIVLQCRFVARGCWDAWLAELACARLRYDGQPSDNGGDQRAEFDRLYKQAYRYIDDNGGAAAYVPFKHYYKYAAMGPVLVFLDWDDSRAAKRHRGFDTMEIQYGSDCAMALTAEDERPCDSHAWFCYPRGYDRWYMQRLVGKTLVALLCRIDDPLPGAEFDSLDDSWQESYDYCLVTQDGQQFPFTLCHQSNGYYSGSLRCEWRFGDGPVNHRDELERLASHCPAAEIVVVVGLPASGKSTYARQHYGGADTATIFDDDELEGRDADMLDPYFVRVTMRELLANKKVCFVSPRFCNAAHYAKFVAGFPTPLHTRITTVLFENNDKQCKQNNADRLQRQLSTMSSQSERAVAQRTARRIDQDILRLCARPYDVWDKTYIQPRRVSVYQSDVPGL